LRVEGHTDNVPINTPSFRSNWELSAARAASVVRLFMQRGIDPARLAVIGLGEFRPVADNATEQGRNQNRRVMVVILNNGDTAEGSTQSTQPDPTKEAADAVPPAPL
jgi:chemotaxis protein MotB